MDAPAVAAPPSPPGEAAALAPAAAAKRPGDDEAAAVPTPPKRSRLSASAAAAAAACASSAGCFTVTFGDVAENHVGMEKLGDLAESGFAIADLESFRAAIIAAAAATGAAAPDHDGADSVGASSDRDGDSHPPPKIELVDLLEPAAAELRKALGKATDADLGGLGLEAGVLVVRRGVDVLLGDAQAAARLERELQALEWDTKCKQRGRVVNKHMRHNLCFGPEHQTADLEAGRGTVYAWREVPVLATLRDRLKQVLGSSAKVAELRAEGNHYYSARQCGIGYHGDSERRLVIAARLGQPIPLHYQWFHRTLPVGPRMEISLQPGDVYIMSEKAVGFDWKRSAVPTLRHAAGDFPFLLKKMEAAKRQHHAARKCVRLPVASDDE